MTHKVHALQSDGLERFTDYIMSLRAGEGPRFPAELLDSPAYAREVPGSVAIERRDFATRFDLGNYLVEALGGLDQQAILHDRGLWSWLALYFFDQLCPADATGSRKASMSYTYVLSRDYRHYSRHAIRTTYYFIAKYGERVRFMFSKAPNERGEIIEQLAARQELASSPGVVEAAHILYDDPERKTFKAGAAGRGAGSINRLIKVLQQFQLTYDLYSVTGEQLVELLPSEFDRFRAAG